MAVHNTETGLDTMPLSRLLAVAAEFARERGFTVLSTTGVQSEAHLAFAGLHQLLRPLRFDQVAPPLFLWGEEAVYRTLGGSELSLRLLPLLAGLGSLFLFARLAFAARSKPVRAAKQDKIDLTPKIDSAAFND